MHNGTSLIACSSFGSERCFSSLGARTVWHVLLSDEWRVLACLQSSLLLFIFQQLLDSCRLVVAVADFTAGGVSTC
jgi:hypothetical protein